MGTHRNPSSRVIGVHGLPTPVISLVQEQAEVRGLFRDPLPDVTHGLRTDVFSAGGRRFGRGRPRRRAVELLLTPDVLVVCDRDPDSDGIGPDTQVTFHRLQQVEVSAADVDGASAVSLLSTPVGSTERSAHVVPTDGGPESARFLEALVDAAQRTRRAADVPVSRMPVDELSPEYS